jgi:hypothetical protein
VFRESPRARSQDPNRAVSRHHPTHDQARPRRPPSHVSHTVHRAPTTGSDEPHPLPQPGLLGRTDPSNGQLNEPQSSGVFPSPLGSLPRPRYVTAPRHRGVALPIHGVLLLSAYHRFASFFVLSRTPRGLLPLLLLHMRHGIGRCLAYPAAELAKELDEVVTGSRNRPLDQGP